MKQNTALQPGGVDGIPCRRAADEQQVPVKQDFYKITLFVFFLLETAHLLGGFLFSAYDRMGW